ncbi:hypothetical protein IGI67_002617 [Enterococcus sp. AZ196]
MIYRDSSKSLSTVVLFVLICISTYTQGYILTKDLNINILSSINTFWPLLDIAIVTVVLCYFKEIFQSIGLIKDNMVKTIIYGVLSGILILFIYILSYFIVFGESLKGVQVGVSNFSLFTFILGAISEEIIFRGYIETRLRTFFSKSLLASVGTAILFIFSHYPFHWAVSGFSLSSLTPFHIYLLAVLHFLCSVVYKESGSLWGAILLHTLYNFGISIMILN